LTSADETRPVAISARRKSSSFERRNGSPLLKRAMRPTWRALNGGLPVTRKAPKRASGPVSTGSTSRARRVS
jgi:hypothetical protein